MKLISFVVVVFCALVIAQQTWSSEILVISPTTAQSHYRVVQPLIYSLLDRGHKILAITNFPDTVERTNLSHIDISGLKPHSKLKTTNFGPINFMLRVIKNADIYASIINHPPVVKLLQSGRKFDLVIVEFFTSTPTFAPIAAVVDAPIIGYCPMITFPWIHDLMGMETTMSYMPSYASSSGDHMSFFQRIRNTINWVYIDIMFQLIYNFKIKDIIKHHYDIQMESVIKSLANLSMIMTNNYHSVFLPSPALPGIVEVGGIHVVDEKPVPQDLNDFINNADYGVILFSLGSVVSEASLSADKLYNILDAFSKLKQRVIMKFDAEKLKIQSPMNVKVVKWFPQRDLLAHPKVLLFITHAGAMSVIETIHCGVPVVAIPIFGDQFFNTHLLIEKEVAVAIEYKHLDSDQLFNAINKALTEKYMINMKKLQQLYHDRPHSPLETAVYWTEYVIRNKNESKELLKSQKIHLNFYQSYLIDVFTVLLLPLIIAMYIILSVIKNLRKH
ncbi:UDP-glucuronosyltransferase 2B18-like [Melanaphis sacchari]|uniref:UDP-glucuronosyltransferase 2B18-like n=1 Tax=Melanaphis sacchari TaxID=742174 RepID=UPI000DC14B63|nr:UDP-glucuronosyltransferase 2B18-like [Melanaphis sacchari]XP_025199770.1 UDP-glucuronosyltransferase 2B18-like [Melanaphis sacchari]XP_025199771.1 UDP-glucuronosyltransferase 2B18-like [Melanaphis sacchari]XP_025199772.1 UDP-glucuronosyltransferase 2B18-like [Melanaphis sacchari]